VKILRSPSELRTYQAKSSASVGFVPTMGALHRGHLTLVERARQENDEVVVSIFVNPLQFDQAADLGNYPRTEESDVTALEAAGVHALFLPTEAQMYGDGGQYTVDEAPFSQALCGADRPGHFKGVLTVVLKLLNLVRPTRLYLGEKDYQQYQLIKGLVEAFFLEIDVIGVPTQREPDGLAMSSRNQRLNPEQRQRAAGLYRLLQSADSDAWVTAELVKLGFIVDYVVTKDGRRFGAVQLGSGNQAIRLIDNVRISA